MQKRAGDAWVEGPEGSRYWGRFGAAGLLAIDPDRGVLLQHRAEWSHHGGTWGIPGGARDEDEDAQTAALREAAEEAGVPAESLRFLFDHVFDLGYWSYTTVVMRVEAPFEPIVNDHESLALAWVPFHEIDSYPLHPGLAASLPALLERLAQHD